MTRYEVQDPKDNIVERPKVYNFLYTYDPWREEYLAFKCFGTPEIYLRTGDVTEMETNVIWITLEGDDISDYESDSDNGNQMNDNGNNMSDDSAI